MKKRLSKRHRGFGEAEKAEAEKDNDELGLTELSQNVKKRLSKRHTAVRMATT